MQEWIPASQFDHLDFSHDHQFILQQISPWLPKENSERDEPMDIGIFGGRTGGLAIELSKHCFDVQFMSCDGSIEYLDQARYNTEIDGVAEQVQLHYLDPDQFEVAHNQFDICICHYHLVDKSNFLQTVQRLQNVLKPDGHLLWLDFCRESDNTQESVQTLAKQLNAQQIVDNASVEAWIHSHLEKSFTLDELRNSLKTSGWNPDQATQSGLLQWAWKVSLTAE